MNCGLSAKEVIESRKKYGTNKISSKQKNSFFKLFVDTLNDPIIRILLIALFIKTLFLFHDFDMLETFGIVAAILVSSLISAISEYGSEAAFEKLQEESSKIKCKVKRCGKVEEVLIDDVVVGDIVLLQTGDKIPADGEIIEGEVYVDESSINGEAREVLKSNNEERDVFRGTVVYSKEAFMLVKKVGDDTFYGCMAKELQEKAPDSPLKIRLRKLAQIISKIGYLGAFLVSFSYLFVEIIVKNGFQVNEIINTITDFSVFFDHILYALTLCVTVIVVAVPEGLPMMITLVLSSNMRRMLKNNVLVRKMVGIETAGSLNILFTDKTGTLTKGKLEVVGLLTGTFNEYTREEELLKFKKFHEHLRNNCIYNNASYLNEKGQAVGGNITDRAVLEFIKSDYKLDYNKNDIVSFDSKDKYSRVTIDNDEKTTYIKGAPEKLLSKCSYYLTEDGNVDILLKKDELESRIDEVTKSGIRVILLAYSNNCDIDRLILIGIIYIKDDIRKEAVEGVGLVNGAGIQTVMITGDHRDTALSIAKEVGIVNSSKDLVLTSDELNQMSADEVKNIIPNLRVVARSLPHDKSRLVKLSQELGLVVGMTGDGVNDAPALKKADVGFAMGSGTEVSKEASDIVILDDNFLSISKAILFGRTIFKSIRKFIIFQLTINLCAIGLSIIGPFIGIETPVTVIQMLWINMIIDTLAGIAFSMEAPLKEYMSEKPKKREENIMNSYMYGEILFTGIYSIILCIFFLKNPWISSFYRLDSKYFMTAFFTLFIFIGVFNSFNARTCNLNLFHGIKQNKTFIFVMLLIVVIQLSIVYFGGDLFRCYGLLPKELIITILFAFSVVFVDLLRKIYLRGKNKNISV